MKKIVSFNTVAEITVTVKVPEAVQAQFADDPDGLREWVIEKAFQNCPSQPCGHCSGFNQSGTTISLSHIEFGQGFRVDHEYDDSNDVRDAQE